MMWMGTGVVCREAFSFLWLNWVGFISGDHNLSLGLTGFAYLLLPTSLRSKLRLAVGSSHAQARAAYKKFMQAERIDWTKKWQSGRCARA